MRRERRELRAGREQRREMEDAARPGIRRARVRGGAGQGIEPVISRSTFGAIAESRRAESSVTIPRRELSSELLNQPVANLAAGSR